MKKIFWTSIVWILLICGGIAYIKWFNQPVADTVAGFINPASSCPTVECDEPVECEECEVCTECQECPEAETTTCNCPAEMAVDNTENWSNVFSKLDKIESLVKNISN